MASAEALSVVVKHLSPGKFSCNDASTTVRECLQRLQPAAEDIQEGGLHDTRPLHSALREVAALEAEAIFLARMSTVTTDLRKLAAQSHSAPQRAACHAEAVGLTKVVCRANELELINTQEV